MVRETINGPYSNGEDRISRLRMDQQTKNVFPNFCNVDDRISKLPDELIHYIMSFNDTKYAVQTSVLSKRWMNTWKSLPFLKFDRSSFSRDKTKKFIEFVYMVFLYRGSAKIQKFSLEWVNSAFAKMVTMNLNIWCLHAIKYNVEEITMIISQCHNSAYEIHHHILNCNSLRKLEIMMSGRARYVDIVLPTSMNLPLLKELSLFGISISGVESSKTLFSSCPVLETLEIIDCDLRNLVVDSLSLKDFEYQNCGRRHLPQNDTTTDIIKLCAPNLQVFACKSLLAQDYSLESCSSLSRAIFDMLLKEDDEAAETYEELPSLEIDLYAKRAVKLLAEVYMVKEMRLSPGFLEALSQAFDLLACQPLRLCNLQQLILEMWSTEGCLQAIAYLLNISPNITKLALVSNESNLAHIGEDWDTGFAMAGILSHLEYVEMKEVEGCDAELKLLTFVLKNANVLKILALSFRSSTSSPDRVTQIEEFKDKLTKVPAASSNIEWCLLIS